ncbi:MAG: ATP-binding protein [Neisseriaceae bacterium]
MSHQCTNRFWATSWLLSLLLMFSSNYAHATPQPATQIIRQAEAAPSTLERTTPPTQGWRSVNLPHQWQQDWPHHQGAVWYRLIFDHQPERGFDSMLIKYLNMAGAVYLNGQLIQQDPYLTEPLSRSWNAPERWPLPTSLLKPGPNVLTLRTIGYANNQAGISTVEYGPNSIINQHYWYETTLRRYVPLVSTAINLILFTVFSSIFLFRQRESAYGWFALMCACWALLSSLFYTTSPWFGLSTAQATNMAGTVLIVYTAAFILFLLTLLHVNLRPYLAKASLGLLIAILSLWLVPSQLFKPVFSFWMLISFIGCICVVMYFIRHAQAHLKRAYRPLTIAMVLCLIGYTYDLMIYLGLSSSTSYLSIWTSNLLLLIVSSVLIMRFSTGLKRLERLNQDLIQQVQLAQYNLGQRLNQQHDLSKAHACLAERLNLVRDLHDGLGATLVANLASTKQPENQPNAQRLAILSALQDDMRLIIETATNDYHGDFYLVDQIATFRHRMTESLNHCHIKAQWHISGLTGLIQSSRQNLDILRFIQEALTNVMKHSQASLVHITIRADPMALYIEINDDGQGFDQQAASEEQRGQGLSSMHMRAQRLNADYTLFTNKEGTRISLSIPTQA